MFIDLNELGIQKYEIDFSKKNIPSSKSRKSRKSNPNNLKSVSNKYSALHRETPTSDY